MKKTLILSASLILVGVFGFLLLREKNNNAVHNQKIEASVSPNEKTSPEIEEKIVVIPESTISAQSKEEELQQEQIAPAPIPTPEPLSSQEPTIEATIDLNVERVILIPEKISSEHEKVFFEKGDGPFTFKQSNKIDSVVVVIRNNGEDDVEDLTVKFIVEGKEIAELEFHGIPAKKSKSKQFDDLDLHDKKGSYKLEVQTNPDKLFAETRYDNNSRIVEYEYTD